MPEITTERYFKEEKANAVTHALGIVMALGGTPFLLNMASENGARRSHFLGIVLFGFSMLVLYLASVIYHSVHDPVRKRFCRKLDHIAIFFLIAGTHTPFILRYLDEPKGWIYLAVLWGLGIAGTLGKLFALEKWDKLSLGLYLFMGWMFIFVLPDVLPVISRDVLTWIGIGGFFYTAGIIFYTREKMWYAHATWHVFVLAGTAGHYVALWKAFAFN